MAQNNIITLKVKDLSDGSSSGTGQVTRHLRISTAYDPNAVQKAILDTNIAGSFNYSFNCSKPQLNITATVTSATPFNNDLEIDVNGQLQAYHGGSCPGTSYSISDYIGF